MNLAANVRPKAALSDGEVTQGLRMITREGVASSAMFSVSSSGLLAAFALALGATNFQVGMLTALPFLTQPLQVPAILLMERLRRRKAVAVACWLPAQLTWIPMALIPFFLGIPSQAAVAMLLGLLALRGALGAVTNCAWNSWVRDLVPQKILGRFFSQRLALSTVAAMVFGLAGAFFVDYWKGQADNSNQVLGYSLVILAGALTLGLAGPWFMALTPEPTMAPASGPHPSPRKLLATPFRDPNFRHWMRFLVFWQFSLNLATPFFTIFMLQQLGFSLSATVILNTLGQLTTIAFLRVWGPLADRFGSKAVLALSCSLYLLVFLGWTFATIAERLFLSVLLVVILQVLTGIASAGVTLTVTTLSMKLSPQRQATSYLAAQSLSVNLGAGLGPLAGGLFTDLATNRLSSLTADALAVHITGFTLLFAAAFLYALASLRILATIHEEGEADRRAVLTELLAPARQIARGMGSVPELRFLARMLYPCLRRLPGLDVAVGVAAYLAVLGARASMTAGLRSRLAAAKTAQEVRRSVAEVIDEAVALADVGLSMPRRAGREAMDTIQGFADEVGHLAQRASAALDSGEEDLMGPRPIPWGPRYGAARNDAPVESDLVTGATRLLSYKFEQISVLWLSFLRNGQEEGNAYRSSTGGRMIWGVAAPLPAA